MASYGIRDTLLPHLTGARQRRTKVTLIDRRTKDLRAIQLLFGYTKLVSMDRYVGIEMDNALEMAEKTEM